MNTLFIIMGCIVLIAGIILAVIISSSNKAYINPNKLLMAKNIKRICIIAGLIMITVGESFTIVPTGHTGVCTTFGQVSENTMHTGFNWKIPFVQNINLVNNKQQDKNISAEIWGETVEKTPVFATDTIITYQISSTRSSWIFANVSNTEDNLIEQSLVASAIKSAMVELSVKEVTNRSIIEPLVKEKLANSLNEKYGEGTVFVLKVIINNMDFEESYNQAIAAKSIAQQIYEKQEIENKTSIAKAEADKKVKIANAEANAQAAVIEARAQADANKLLVESLTDEVLRSKFYDKWDGQLPTVMGENTVIADIGK